LSILQRSPIPADYLDASLPPAIHTFKAISLDGDIVLEKASIPILSTHGSDFLVLITSSEPPSSAQPDSLTRAPNELPPTPPAPKKRPHENSNPDVVKRQKKLDNWFKQGSRDDIIAYHQRMDLEWSENLEEIRIEDGKRHSHQKELAAERKRRQRDRETEADIKSGKRDTEGKIIKKKLQKVYYLFLQFSDTLTSRLRLFNSFVTPNQAIPLYLRRLDPTGFSRKRVVKIAVLLDDLVKSLIALRF